MAATIDIASKTRRVDVDNQLSLRFYYRTAANLLKQASIYRDEYNVIDLYILLLRFSSLVSETIPDHRDYRATFSRERVEYKKKLADVLGELEALKPEVQRQVDRLNKAHHLPDPTADESVWAQYTSRLPSASSRSLNNGKVYEELNKELTQSRSGGYHEAAARAGDYWSSPSIASTIHTELNSLSINIPRPRDETLSRHSVFGPNIPRRQSPVVPFRAHYPSYVDASPIDIPSLDQDRRVPLQPSWVSTSSNSVDVLAEPVLWPEADTRPFPGGYSPVIGPDLAPAPSLVRQPDPPPVLAPVHTIDSPDHPSVQLAPERVADPFPGVPQQRENDLGEEKGTKHLHISPKMMEEFLGLARLNTQNNLETCAVLAGNLKNGVFYVSTLIIPKQEATSDSCQTLNEEEIFEVQDKRGLFQLGWIHTHPTQICFMSSVDLHTHYSYQIMLQEAVAIVMAPTDTRKYGIFRLSDPGGVKSIQQCDKRGFHPHEDLPDGSSIYEHCQHVFMNSKLRFDVIDLR